jgi:uncharacterized protein (DUF2141 family)
LGTDVAVDDPDHGAWFSRALWALLLVVGVFVAGRLGAQPSAAKKTGRVTVEIVGLHSAQGRVLVAMYCGEEGFPSEFKKTCANKVVNAQKGRMRVQFDAVPAGEFAISMFHDENSNKTLDTNFLGMPKEGWGTSRDAKANFGPPSYSDARVLLAAGEHKQVVVHVRY